MRRKTPPPSTNLPSYIEPHDEDESSTNHPLSLQIPPTVTNGSKKKSKKGSPSHFEKKQTKTSAHLDAKDYATEEEGN